MFTRESNPGWIDRSRNAAARNTDVTHFPRDAFPTPPAAAGKGGRKSSADGPGQGTGTAVIARTKPQTQRPSMYRVLLLNDDYTPMDFVIGVLCTFFHKNFDDANRIMWQVHNNGVGECGVYTYEVADTKVTQVMDHARKHQHPLQCVMEKK
ncbi:ATP-dependent Clp protease adapter ClpS [Rhodoblastus acidophilus]|uniref:ATP-dependent Clp protease adapter protein ClpS n=1 Tax=Candidatus Rhodoblastus alkanivorans TaxID=2954117 RepID=A0ABS9Z650_9HYPH|nr:ATP-dependent Clp protease adapter ClpS [Candidatus Rhodoblastus alkanivorans]MCI4680289.1 ATP-dependent Clp protease adapter ClpS [Candidatus Rhodoblastus alkanivorans]MCI4683108.1 ATP-dependent Clp protease adapter ClpS [Candidatus Rhodoblastus alkanivorans]MDI4640419.1 ATP-dependent Clp protease adapter ClpS [Rhodoblastus acidophilus]